ncbi:hypothetical protein [Paraglaciecola chathamensis]|uniref:hypothetical protein n=1 Tax=Paraglaciecola chathamensis TaxID=368405 RepID=UPI0036330633
MDIFTSSGNFEPELMDLSQNKTFQKMLKYCDEVYSYQRYKVVKRMIETTPKLEEFERNILLESLETAVIVNSNNGIYKTQKQIDWERANKAWLERG